jgi:hypothetical protein
MLHFGHAEQPQTANTALSITFMSVGAQYLSTVPWGAVRLKASLKVKSLRSNAVTAKTEELMTLQKTRFSLKTIP